MELIIDAPQAFEKSLREQGDESFSWCRFLSACKK